MNELMRHARHGLSRGLKKGGIALLLTLAASVIAAPQSAEAAAVKVGTAVTGTASAASSFTVTMGAVPTIGNTLVAVISTRSTTAKAVSAVTQTGVNWARVASTTGTSGSTTEIWAGTVGSTSATGITISLTSATYAAAVVQQYSGILTGSPADKAAVNSNTTAGTAATTGTTGTTIQADELWVAGFGLVNSTYTATTPTNFTAVGNASVTNNVRAYYFDQNVLAAGAASAASTVSTSSFWSGAIATFRAATTSCGTCHGTTTSFTDSATRNVAGNFQGSHNGHVVVNTMACSACHSTNPTTTNHSNGTVTIATPISGGTYGKASFTVANTFSPSTCNNTTCHGTASPTWGSNSAATVASCVKCHGVAGTTTTAYNADTRLAAPGYSGGRDTGGATVATDAEVGAHAVHLTANTYYPAMACNQCHSNVNPASASFTGHMDGNGTVSFGDIASKNSSPAYSAPNCTNTYCHYGSSVSWTNTALLAGTTADCNKCHGLPPATNHDGVAANVSSCNGCHDHVNTDGSFADLAKHVNGVVDGGCSQCHGWPPTTNAHTTHIDNIKTAKGLSSLPGGFVNNTVCGVCHNVSALTKHAGTVGNDGTSRNIYLPAAYGNQTSHQFGANDPVYDKASTTTCSNISCHLGATPAWGTPPTTACQSCHGYPPVTTVGDVDNKHFGTPVNHIGTGSTVNTKTGFVDAHGGCQICHGTMDSGSGTHNPFITYTVATQHFTGKLNMNGPTGTGVGYNATTKSCDNACHSNAAPYVMSTAGKTLYLDFYGNGGTCITCHASVVNSPIAAAIDPAVTTRPDVVTPFNNSAYSRHIRSRGGSVTNADCGVCHMEGDAATGSPNATYHKNGRIELRDPDLGTTIKGVTHNGTTAAAGAYTSTTTDARPVRFSRNLGSATLEADVQAIMVNQCLKCHDANGANSATARVTGGTAGRPFGAAITANPGSNVLDVSGQFASSNKAHHPVLVRTNNGYTNTGSSRMVAPWNGVAKTASTTVYGPLITCWDCHAPLNTASTVTLITSGVHGAAVAATGSVALRGTVYTSGTTAATNLCLYCHVVSGGTTNHGTGSAITSSTNGSMTYFQNRCFWCHGYNTTRVRPNGAGDAHGYNTRANGTAFPAVNNGYAFIRSEGWYANSYTHSIRSIGATTYTPTCGGVGAGTGCSRTSMGGYTPGGVY